MENINENTLAEQPFEFHLGLTMAGAASAGCYTAGAMDYLFEIMSLWENAKGKNPALPPGWDAGLLKHVPQHKVTIDAMGGTSAGGMTTVMAAIYALNGQSNPVSIPPVNPTQKKNNVMYDSWVLMADEAGKPEVFEKTFNTDDLTQTGKIQSLLNSGFIDEICDNAFKGPAPKTAKFPFIADDLELVLSHTMLRSIPLAIDFTTAGGQERRTKKSPEHSTFEHFTISHFKLNYNAQTDKDKCLPLDPFGGGAAALKLATMATGAFPVGLKFREFFAGELSTTYLKNTTEAIAFNRLNDIAPADVPKIDWPDNFPDPYKFVSIDGGAINNEPFGEVLGILKERHGKKKPGDDYKYALVMIDPFPDVPPEEEYKQPDDLFTVVPAIIGTLWDQSKVKRAEMLDAYSSDYYRGEIFPLRWKKRNADEHHPIACGAAMAFAGLMDIDFRRHDFFLGRDNARNFYRTYFSIPCKLKTAVIEGEEKPVQPYEIISCHPIHKNWSHSMIKMFKRPGKDAGTVLLPIIPDLYILKEIADTGKERDPFLRTSSAWPKYDAQKLFALKDKIRQRVLTMLELTYKKMSSGDTNANNPVTAALMKTNYRSNWFKKFTGWVGGGILHLLFKLNKGKIANRITKAAIEWFLKDLEKNELL